MVITAAATRLCSTVSGLQRLLQHRPERVRSGCSYEASVTGAPGKRLWLIPVTVDVVHNHGIRLNVQYVDNHRWTLAVAEVDNADGELRIGIGDCSGQVAAFDSNGRQIPVRIIDDPTSWNVSPLPKLGSRSLWAPTAAAMTVPAWQRFRHLRIVLFGAGRVGSLIASAIVRNGGHVVLLDTDHVESANVGEMDVVDLRSVGHRKAFTLADRLNSLILRSDGRFREPVQPVSASALSMTGLRYLKSADLVITAVDNAAARLGVACIAAAMLKPVLDIGTGIQRTEEHRTMGADVRLTFPGRCLRCFGGITDEASGAESFLRGQTAFDNGHWQEQRSGSLRSLNMMAVGIALRMLEDWLAGILLHSRHVHLRFGDVGEIRTTTNDATGIAAPGCSICRLAGHGDAALFRLAEMVSFSGTDDSPESREIDRS